MSAMDTDVPTCRIERSLVEAMHELDNHPGWEQCVVVDDGSVVMGVVRRQSNATTRPLGEVVRYGPTTVRPDDDLDDTRDRMRERKITERIVTDPNGRLLGVLRLEPEPDTHN